MNALRDVQITHLHIIIVDIADGECAKTPRDFDGSGLLQVESSIFGPLLEFTHLQELKISTVWVWLEPDIKRGGENVKLWKELYEASVQAEFRDLAGKVMGGGFVEEHVSTHTVADIFLECTDVFKWEVLAFRKKKN